jgi:hypothetical protein
MVKRVVFLAIVLVAIGLTFAQEQKPVRFGIRIGLNLASLNMSEDSERSGDSYSSSETSNVTVLTGNLIGFHAGAVIDIKLLEFLYFQPGIMFGLKGGSMEYEYKEVYDGDVEKDITKITIAPYYIDLPLNLSLKGNLANNLALRTYVGSYIGFGLFGDMKVENKSSDSGYPEYNSSYSQKVKLFSKEKDCDEDYGCSEGITILDRFNFGIDFGVGIEYRDFYLGVSYNYGLANLLGKDMKNGGKWRERTLGITFGYNL